MKIFITGGTGFIGSHLVKRLMSDRHEVIVTGNSTEVDLPSNVTCLQCHLNGIDYDSLGSIDICFHLAGCNDTLSVNRKEMYRANVDAPKELFDRLLNNHSCKKIIYASSASVYGNGDVPFLETNIPDPLSIYAESKLAFDQWIDAANMPAIGLRFSNVYGVNEQHKGRRSSLISQIISKLIQNQVIKLFKHGEQKRDWVFVEDVVSLNLLAMKSDLKGIFNCGSGQLVSFNELIQNAECIVKKQAKVEYVDCFLGDNFQNNTMMSLDKASLLGYIPEYSIKQGMSILAEEYGAIGC